MPLREGNERAGSQREDGNLLKRPALMFGLFLCLFVLLPGEGLCEGKPRKLCVQLKWLHQAQFAGFYVAKDEGYYREEALEVEFFEGGPHVRWLERMADPSCPVGITNAHEIIIGVSKGLPVQAIAAIDQVSPIVFFSLRESGIRDPRQFKGKRVALVPTGKLHFLGMMQKVGVDVKDVVVRPFSFDMTPLYEGQVDVWSGYHTNIVIRAEDEGHSVNVIHPVEYGIQIYDDVIYVRRELAEGSPEVVEGFLRATLKGWSKAVREPEEALEITMRYVKDAEHAHEARLLKRTIPYVHTGEVPVGWMEKSVWEDIAVLARDVGLTEKPVSAGSVFTDRFLKAIYGEELP